VDQIHEESGVLAALPAASDGLKILVADDDSITRLTLKTLLARRGYDVVTAHNGEEAYKLLQREDAPRLAILDWVMPGMEGIELCRKLRETGKAGYVYVIMLSSRAEKDDFIAGMEAGADDYISKPFDIDELHVRVRAGQRIVTLQEQLRIEASEDKLTGLFNRGAISGILRRELSHAKREGTPLSVVLADLDNFKNVNDTHGHPVGDAVLREVSNILGTRLRPDDALGRYGGEEFLMVLPGCGIEGALEIAERMRGAVACEPIVTPVGPLEITASFGVAATDDESVDVDALVLEADKALYRAKRAGRDRVEGPVPYDQPAYHGRNSHAGSSQDPHRAA
jgi:two-component system, cell cycle response regulator